MNLHVGRAYLPLYRLQDKFILMEGPRGTLKTISALDCLMSRAAQYPGKRWYLWRSTRALLSTTVLPSFEEYVLPRWKNVTGMRLVNPDARPTQRSEYVFANGSVFLPIGMDDVLRGTSAEGAGGYLAEAIELASSNQATALVGMMRQPGVPFHQIIVDVNPGPPNHWANHIAEPVPDALRQVRNLNDYMRIQDHNNRPAKGGWKRIITRVQDNQHFFDLEKWQYTPAGQSYIDGLKNLSPHMRARWLDGLWRAAEGTVYANAFRDEVIIPPFRVPETWPVYCYMDPGEDHPTACGWFCITPSGKGVLIGEVHGSCLGGVPGVAKLMREKEKAMGVRVRGYYMDPRHGFSKTFQSTSTIAEQFFEHGYEFSPAGRFQGKGYQASVEAVRTSFMANNLLFFDDCTGFIADHNSWSYARNTDGTVKPGDDAYEKINDDGCDVCRWFVAAKHRFDGSMDGRQDHGADEDIEDVVLEDYTRSVMK